MKKRFLVQFVNDVDNDYEGTATNDLDNAHRLARNMAGYADVRILDRHTGRTVAYIPHRTYTRGPDGR